MTNNFRPRLSYSVLSAVLTFAAAPTLSASTGKSCRALMVANSQIATQDNSSPFNEWTLIRNGHKQYPDTAFLSSSYFGDTYYYQDALGDLVRVEIYPNGNPLDPRNQQNQITNSTPTSRPQLGYGGSNSRNVPAVVSAQNQVALSEGDKYRVAREYLLNLYGDRLDERSLEYVISTIVKDPKLMNEAIKTTPLLKLQKSQQIKISNVGEDRYFWFQPIGSTQPVAARVLDLHRYKNNVGFTILAEYTAANEQTGLRTRHVFEISEAEFHTIKRTGEFSAANSRQAFIDTLSPLEMETQKLAASLKLKLFGFSSFGRGPGLDSSLSSTPLQMMNNISWMAMDYDIRKRWNYDDLKTPAERNVEMLNVIDVFSRLNPSYVLERFKSLDMEYMWAITEDGQLKVMPKMKLGNNLKPQLLRLSAGRRIFGGGDFKILADGSLEVTRDSNDYQNLDSQWGSADAFAAYNPNLDKFISAVFALHAQAKVTKINSQKAPEYFTADSRSHRNASASSGATRDEAFDFVNNMKARKSAQGETTSKKKKDITWDSENGFPLFLDSWLKESGLPSNMDKDKNIQIRWAHYVLKTDDTMPWAEIKKSIRKMNSRFLVNAITEDSKHLEAQKAVNVAAQTLEAVMK